MRVLATCYLLTIGVGYLFALLYLFLIDVEPHSGKGAGLVSSVIIKYYGKREDTRLETALKGTMAEYVTTADRQRIMEWIRAGAGQAEFAQIQPILQRACMQCHSAQSGMPIAPLTSFEEVIGFTRQDLGESVKSLVRVSHIHLFGMSFLFALTSAIFMFSETSAVFRSILIAIPFVAIWMDIGSWWLTKYQPFFAYTVIAGGVLMGLSLAGQIVIPLYEMWLKRDKKILEPISFFVTL
jgi:hypothetical protein